MLVNYWNMPKNIQPICRACLRKCKGRRVLLQDTFPEDGMQEPIMYSTAYAACTQLDMTTGADGMPKYLCNRCSRDLQDAYEFRNKAIRSFEKLLSQIALQKQENVARAVSPSEFELPDNHTAAAYMRADADIIDACSMEVAKRTKDPLEDSESENESENKLKSPASIHTFSDNAYDTEDDKPLKQLIIKKECNVFNNYDVDENNVAFTKTASVPLGNQPLYDDDELRGDENIDNEEITDSMFSPEAHIFPKGRFKCAICEQNYFTSIGLKAHMEVHLAKSVTTKKKRTRNKKRKSSIKPDSEVEVSTLDTSCDKSNPCQSINSKKLEKETEQHKDQNYIKKRKPKEPKPKRMFPCHVCGKHMISASKLRYHMVMHTGEKDYLCTMCPKAYSTIYALKHHIRTHTGERPYECKFCGDRFLRPTTLKSHQRRHTGERPYGCDVCGKRFIQHSSMTTHMKLNHMDKTIQCPHCDKKYARQTDLNTHLLSHTGDKPYPCQLCPSRFVRQANLNKHMNQQHAGKASAPNLSSATAAKKINKDVAIMHHNDNKLIFDANDVTLRSSNATCDETFQTGSNIVENCRNFLSSQNENYVQSQQTTHILTEEQLNSDNLVPWNC
ncbi:zinc finger protein 26-like isoform X2 [Rhagoletis pomonella]|uniref:zinc finger protein 26-like isoform X2 n=1 Tax=Rhagoletis pomonella TaxID=28610 RepID=UPI00177F8C5B|nr:zinc finger protein 26-like isoform X2 [Rhagoletis pomonella]